jgi:hypothetical protein
MEFRSENIPRNRLGMVSAEESVHFEAFRVPRKSQFRSSERNGTDFRRKKNMTLTVDMDGQLFISSW